MMSLCPSLSRSAKCAPSQTKSGVSCSRSKATSRGAGFATGFAPTLGGAPCGALEHAGRKAIENRKLAVSV